MSSKREESSTPSSYPDFDEMMALALNDPEAFEAERQRHIDAFLENVPEARNLSKQNRLCLATSDTWLLHRLLARKGCFTILVRLRTILAQHDNADHVESRCVARRLG